MAKDIEIGPLVAKYGGEFRLTAICQKRMRELARGARPLVDVPRGRPDILNIVLRELQDGRIEPVEGMRAQTDEEILTIDLNDD